METFLIRALQFIMALALLVTIHEGGHFLFAKLFKVRVEKFYLFFDPWFSLFKFKPKNSETEYGVGWLPLGGYVKIAGMVDESQNAEDLNHPVEPWEFRAKPAWQRLFIMIGGVLMNFLLALVLYSMILFTWGDSYVPLQSMEHGMKFNERAKEIGFQNGDILLRADDKAFTRYGVDMLRDITEADFVYVKRNGEEVAIDIPEDLSLLTIGNDATPFIDMLIPAVIDSVLDDYPAKQVGIMQGDTLLAINNRAVSDFVEFTTQIAALRARSDSITAPEKVAALRDITLVVGRTSGRDTLFAQLNEDFKLGVQPALYEPLQVEYGFLASFPAGIQHGLNVLKGYVSDMKYVFTKEGASSLGGFVTIGSIFPATWDWQRFWEMTAFLSIILAFMNILPIPALDGGHVLFLLYEVITRRKPSDKFMERAQVAGMLILFALLIWANFNDVLRFL